MKRALAFSAVLAAAAARGTAPAAAQFQGSVIYGSDTRIDLYQTDDARLLSLADSTVALFQSGDVSAAGGVAALATRNYGEAMGLCKEEPFYEQGEGAFCSGSLVAPDVILTAGHCVPSAEECAGVKFVFGFAVKRKGVLPESVPAGDVYGCGKLIGRERVDDGPDWALVRLDRKVAGHAPLKLNRSGRIESKTELLVIGHPAGLPTKIAGSARVRDNSKEGFFVASLNTYGGNSGSAVFNSATGLVEGVLVRGEEDYVRKGDCRVSKVCPTDGCRGEDVTRISRIADKVSAAEHRTRVAALRPSIADALANLTAGERR